MAAATLLLLGCSRDVRGPQEPVAKSATVEKEAPGASSSPASPQLPRSPIRNETDGRLAILQQGSRVAGDSKQPAVTFRNVASLAGIHFVHTDGGTGKAYTLEGMASGVVTADYDADGFVDIYFLNGTVLGPGEDGSGAVNALYRNNGDLTFTDVTAAAGVGDKGFALGGVSADYDNDGLQDIYVSNYLANLLYHNNGDGTFTDVAGAAGVTNAEKVGAGCSFFDFDADGLLDLYAASYVDFRYDNYVPIVIDGVHFQAGPQYYTSVPDTLYKNLGDGTFLDVSEGASIEAHKNAGMATLATDLNEDGLPDVFVCNDGQPNSLFINEGDGRFSERALQAGVAFDFYGKANSSMGVDIGDLNADGRPDLFVTDYQSEMPVLYENLGGGSFRDATTMARVSGDLFAHVHWGTVLADFDNDGDQDVFVACGHFDPVELIDDRTAKKVRNYLLLNDGSGRLSDVSEQAGEGMQVVESSRGVACEDFDNDGDLDMLIVNSGTVPTLLRNDVPHTNAWLQVDAYQDKGSQPAVGAVVRVQTDIGSHTDWIVAGRGYQSGFGGRLHFGLGRATRVESVEVLWPGGKLERFAELPINARIKIRSGSGDTVGRGT